MLCRRELDVVIMNDGDYLALGVTCLVFGLIHPSRTQRQLTPHTKVLMKNNLDKIAATIVQGTQSEQESSVSDQVLHSWNRMHPSMEAKQPLAQQWITFFLLYAQHGYSVFRELAIHLGNDYARGTKWYGRKSVLQVLMTIVMVSFSK